MNPSPQRSRAQARAFRRPSGVPYAIIRAVNQCSKPRFWPNSAHTVVGAGNYWMDVTRSRPPSSANETRRAIVHRPRAADLTMSARATAQTKRSDGIAQRDSSVGPLATAEAERLDRLAAKCERIRKSGGVAARARPGSGHNCDRNGKSVQVTMDAPTCSFCHIPQVFD
jgi:hypothetical protein